MTQPNGRIYVDPDGVTRTGDQYGEHARTYAGLLAHVQSLSVNYHGCWGNDPTGSDFGRNYQNGVRAAEGLIKAVEAALRHASLGLRAGGREYRTADEDARDAGMMLARNADDYLARGLAAPATPAGSLASASLATPATPAGSLTSAAAAGAGAATPQTPFQSATPAAEPGQLAPTPGTSPVEPATWLGTATTPAMSAYDTLDLSDTYVDGQPLPDGQHVVAFTTAHDGTVRIDVNLYESLMPVAGSAVASPDGQQIDTYGRQFFVVRDASDVDPSAPGYQPVVVSYRAGG